VLISSSCKRGNKSENIATEWIMHLQGAKEFGDTTADVVGAGRDKEYFL
jgi:hypothetical protein